MRHHQPLLSYGASGAGFAASPSFYAPLTNTLVLTTATGTATPTFSVTVSGGLTTVTDWEGVVRQCNAAEARFTGARRVANMFAGNSQDFSNASWLKNSFTGTGALAVVVTANFATDPLGGSTACRIQPDKGTDAAVGLSQMHQPITISAVEQHSYRGSIWLKANSGTPTVGIRIADNVGTVATINVTLSSSWQRFTTAVSTPTQGRTSIVMGLGAYGTNYGGAGNTQAPDILAWGALFEDVSGQSNQNPGEYVSVGVTSAPYHGAAVDGIKYFATLNGNTVASNVVTEATGAAITSSASGASTLTTDASAPFGFACGGTYGNGAIGSAIGDSEDLSTWTLSNATVTLASSIASPAGYLSKNALIENTTNAPHAADKTFAKTASSVSFASVWVKPGTRNQYILQFSDGVGVLQIFVNNLSTTPLITPFVTGTYTHTASGTIAYPNGWHRVWVYFTGSSAVSHTWQNRPCVGGSDVYAGVNGNVALYLWGMMYLQGRTTADIPEYIHAGVSRAGDDLNYVFASNASATVGTAYAETRVRWSANPGYTGAPLIAFSTGTNLPLYNNNEASTTIRVGDGTNSVQKTGVSDMNTAVRKCASSWTGATLRVTSGGATAASGTFDGNMGSTEIAIGVTTTYSANSWNGTIRNVKLFVVAATAAELASMTT